MDLIYRRRQNRLDGDLYRIPGAYFITICSRDRMCVFWRNDIPISLEDLPLSESGQIAKEEILTLAEGYGSALRVEKCVVMPNHIHMLLVMEESQEYVCPDIRYVVRLFKRKVTQRIGNSVWQKGFHDHIVRNDHEYREIWKYIDENPAKWVYDRYYSDDYRIGQ